MTPGEIAEFLAQMQPGPQYPYGTRQMALCRGRPQTAWRGQPSPGSWTKSMGSGFDEPASSPVGEEKPQ